MTAALAASILGLVVVSGSGYAWFRSQRALRQSRLDLVLREAEVLRDQASQAGDDVRRWAKAVDAVRAAERLMADARDEQTRVRLVTLLESVTNSEKAAYADRKLLEDLIDVRSAKADDGGGPWTDAMYTAAFQQAGLDLNVLPPNEAGAKIRARPAAVAVTIVAAIDDWAAVRRTKMGDRPGGARLAEVARAADSDPWRAACAMRSTSPTRRSDLKHCADWPEMPTSTSSRPFPSIYWVRPYSMGEIPKRPSVSYAAPNVDIPATSGLIIIWRGVWKNRRGARKPSATTPPRARSTRDRS